MRINHWKTFPVSYGKVFLDSMGNMRYPAWAGSNLSVAGGQAVAIKVIIPRKRSGNKVSGASGII
jgi:hypothetical protein